MPKAEKTAAAIAAIPGTIGLNCADLGHDFKLEFADRQALIETILLEGFAETTEGKLVGFRSAEDRRAVLQISRNGWLVDLRIDLTRVGMTMALKRGEDIQEVATLIRD
jgi:hypothetical protein